MSKTVKDAGVRRNEILETAQALFYSKGFARTSVQEIIDTIGIAKGTFYYYFGSKTDLLCALVERMMAQILQETSPIIANPDLSAPEKFDHFFAAISNWKTERKDFLLSLLEVWNRDDNILLRQKVNAATAKSVEPLLSAVIRQGIGEGVFHTAYPDDAARMIFVLSQDLSETLAEFFLRVNDGGKDLAKIAEKVAAYHQAMERILDAPPNSLHIVDMAVIRAWFE